MVQSKDFINQEFVRRYSPNKNHATHIDVHLTRILDDYYKIDIEVQNEKKNSQFNEYVKGITLSIYEFLN